jgi:hypothetical protein
MKGDLPMPTTQWGRKETIIWPPHSPIYTYGAIFLSFVAAGLFVYVRFSFALTPLQQFYLPYYLRTGVAGAMHKTDKYQLLTVADGRNHARGATGEDVEKGTTPEPGGKHLHSGCCKCTEGRRFDCRNILRGGNYRGYRGGRR